MKQKLEFPRLLFSPSAYCIRQLNLLFILVFSYFCFYDNPLLPPQFPWTRKESPWLMDSEVLVDSDVWAPEVRLNITQDYPGWLLQVLGSRSGDSFRVLASKISYVKIQGVPAILPLLIRKVYHSSSLGSGSRLLGQHGENGPILTCRGQTLVTQQGIPPLLGVFRYVCTYQICS